MCVGGWGGSMWAEQEGALGSQRAPHRSLRCCHERATSPPPTPPPTLTCAVQHLCLQEDHGIGIPDGRQQQAWGAEG